MHNIGTSFPFKENSSDQLNNLNKLKLLTNFDVNLTSFLGEEMNNVSDVKLVTPPGKKSSQQQNLSGVSIYEGPIGDGLKNDQGIFL